MFVNAPFAPSQSIVLSSAGIFSGIFLKKFLDNSSKVDVVNGLLGSRERPPEALAVTWRPRRHLRSATGKSILASREMPAKQGHSLSILC